MDSVREKVAAMDASVSPACTSYTWHQGRSGSAPWWGRGQHVAGGRVQRRRHEAKARRRGVCAPVSSTCSHTVEFQPGRQISSSIWRVARSAPQAVADAVSASARRRKGGSAPALRPDRPAARRSMCAFHARGSAAIGHSEQPMACQACGAAGKQPCERTSSTAVRTPWVTLKSWASWNSVSPDLMAYLGQTPNSACRRALGRLNCPAMRPLAGAARRSGLAVVERRPISGRKPARFLPAAPRPCL